MRAIELGATLYTPALNPAAMDNAYGACPDLRSMVICLEDAIRDDELAGAEQALKVTLQHFTLMPPTVHVFVRPRSPQMLARILAMPGAEHLAGFVLPKITAGTVDDWFGLPVADSHLFMPTIEGKEAFDPVSLGLLRDRLLPFRERILAVRVGGNDLLSLIGVRRSRFRTAYDGLLGVAILNITAAFASHGFSVTAPVFEHFGDHSLLAEEVEQDIENGLLTKTAVHPSQIPVIQRLYKPSAADLMEARAILDNTSPAVFGANGSMCEPATHSRWAENIVQRAQIYGIAEGLSAADSRVA
jgi:citrate lyase beta subunit